MKYERIKEFIKRTKKSRSTIYRFYNKNVELHDETKMIDNKRVIPIDHAKYFDSEILFDENKGLRLENKSMRSVIEYLVDKDSLASRLWEMEWDFFITVAYKSDRTKNSCFRQMNMIFEELEKVYGDKTEIRMFFTTEPFSSRSGHHNHFSLYVSNKKLHEEIIWMVQDFFNYDRVDIKKYDKFQAGLFYMTKGGLINEDWDLLGNNLIAKGTNYENKSD